MRIWLVLPLLLAACSSGGGNRIVKAALEQILPGKEAEAPSGGGGGGLTRAAVEASGAAMIRARLLSDDGRTILAAASENGGYVTYASRIQQTLTLRGSLVTASRGLGHDLLSVRTFAGDPVVTPTPLADWPDSVLRTYIFPDTGPGGREVGVICRYEVREAREIEIVEVTHRGTQVAEFCTGDAEFQNLHFVGSETGRVWRSLQWLGPEQGTIDIEIIEPFTP